MNRVKYTTTSGGTGDLTLTVATGFVGHQASGYTKYAQPFESIVFYHVISEDGSQWEFGQCTMVLGVSDILERSTGVVIQSTNSNSLVNFPSGTHTVFLSRGAMEGEIRSDCLIYTDSGLETSVSVAASGSLNCSWTDYLKSHNAVSGLYAPSRPLLSEFSPATVVQPENFAGFARAVQLQLWVEPSTSGNFKTRIEFYDSTLDETVAWEARGDNNIVVLTSPWFGDKHPFDINADVTCLVYNQSAGSISFKSRLYMTYAI